MIIRRVTRKLPANRKGQFTSRTVNLGGPIAVYPTGVPFSGPPRRTADPFAETDRAVLLGMTWRF